MASLPPPPPALKPLVPFLQRADEFEKKDPITAYYCRYYAAQQAIKEHGGSKDKAVTGFLIALMDKMEGDKKKLGNIEAVKNDLVGQAHVEDFALKLFNFADNKDRAGLADKNIARAFYAASTVLDVLKVFGELDPELVEKQKYAKWKAVDITHCLRNGITPKPGPPGGDGETDAMAVDGEGASGDAAMANGGYGGANGGYEGGFPPAQPHLPPAQSHFTPEMPSVPSAPGHVSFSDGSYDGGAGGGMAGGMGGGGGLPYPPNQQPHSIPYNQPPPGAWSYGPGAPAPSAGDLSSQSFGSNGRNSFNNSPTPHDVSGGHPPSSSPRPTPMPRPAQQPQQPQQPQPQARPQAQPPAQHYQPQPVSYAPAGTSGQSANPSDFPKVQKYCKFAISALEYDDVAAAVANLQKAMNLLTLGHE